MDVEDYAKRLIHHKAKELIGRYGFTRSDQEDIEQELTLRLIGRWRYYDPARGRPATFYKVVVARGIASILEHRRAPTRTPPSPIVSLSRRSWGEYGTEAELADLVPGRNRSRSDQSDLRIDLAKALDGLPATSARCATSSRRAALPRSPASSESAG